ncbi:hypothetical protein NGRA_2329, partial [Nosema granulosis]
MNITLMQKKDGIETWRCVDRTCQGRITLNLKTGSLKVVATHSHHANVFKIRRMLLNKQVVDLAERTEYNSTKIYEMVIEDLSALDAMLLTKKNVQKLVSYTRSEKQQKKGNSIEELPAYLLKTQRLEPFLLHQSSPGKPKLLIFTTSENLEILMLSSTWISDGTFQSCPSDYLQLYVIFGSFMGKFVPLVYALMEGKTSHQYEYLFSQIKIHLKGKEPKDLIIDNEKAVQSGFLRVFPQGRISLCFF